MSNIVIEVMVVDVTQPEGKKFKNMEVTYKNKSFNDKTETKKINSYYGKAVFPILEDAKKGDVFTITREKEGEFWQWTGISEGAAGKPAATTGSQTSTGGTTQNRSFVADSDKQVMIIRQSSISSAVNLLKDTSQNPKAVLEVAEMFENYVLNGRGEDKLAAAKVVPKANALPADLDDDLSDLPI